MVDEDPLQGVWRGGSLGLSRTRHDTETTSGVVSHLSESELQPAREDGGMYVRR